MINNWIHLFINPVYQQDDNQFLQAKNLLRAFLFTGLSSTSYFLISYIIDFSHGVNLMIMNMIGFLLLTLMLRFRFSLDLLGNLYVLIGASGVVGVIYFSGGLNSPILAWLAACPPLALMLIGKRSAMVWALLMIVCLFFFAYLAYIDFPLPPNFNGEWEIIFKVHIISGLIFLTFLINLVFNNTKEKTRKIVEEKNLELINALEALEGARVALEKSHDDIVLANMELVRQKEIIENKNRAITSNLRYAKDMQNAIMPNPYILQSLFVDSFYMMKPLKIVSGDFFWTTRVDGLTFVAVVDCTGHGVPGALMSVIGNNLLKEAVKIKKLSDPPEILSFLHKGVCAALHQEETASHDGMEIGLCVIDEEKRLVLYSGAKISLFMAKEGGVEQIKADNQSIGGMYSGARKEFSLHSIPLDSPTRFYMFTDGLKDQFGGPSGKKFMLRRITQTINHIYQLPMPMQKSYIAEIINDWMKGEEQLDDITIVGFQPNHQEKSTPSPAGSGFSLLANN
ncbi:PP2C family protein-serine/threonine phosphatase [Nafulsella turpanensis]|uniref:PP2C family protein-serine/threonine phosphatase n=1 Tax=Nafulsella turpanensis TaxID=1265690 RepID=UPI000362862B|nr:SpoIIE family protein phosphatase [Nafulsella turpanensis]